MNIHHIHEFVYEQDDGNCFLYDYNCLWTGNNKDVNRKRLKV